MTKTITAHYRGKPITIQVDSVTHFTAADGYATAHHAEGDLILNSHDTLLKLEGLYPEFARVSKNTMVRRSLVTGSKRFSRYHDGHRGGELECAGIGPITVGPMYVKRCGFF